ncbi:unnamed protein product [Absidia cylindrospora]
MEEYCKCAFAATDDRQYVREVDNNDPHLIHLRAINDPPNYCCNNVNDTIGPSTPPTPFTPLIPSAPTIPTTLKNSKDGPPPIPLPVLARPSTSSSSQSQTCANHRQCRQVL